MVVTGESLVTGCAKAGRWLVWLIFATPLIKRFVTGLIQILLLGTAVHLVFPLPTRYSVAIWALVSWSLVFALLYWGRYWLVEKFSKPLAVVMGGSLAIAAFLSRPDWAAAAKASVIPSFPEHQGLYGTALVIMGVAGGAIGSFGNLKYSAFVHEKGWRDLSYLGRQRLDLALSSLGMFVILALIQIAAAGALRPLGIQVAEVEDLVPVFAQVLGDAGRIVLAAGICVSNSSRVIDLSVSRTSFPAILPVRGGSIGTTPAILSPLLLAQLLEYIFSGIEVSLQIFTSKDSDSSVKWSPSSIQYIFYQLRHPP